MNLSEYILLPREQRVAHINLNSPCECYNGEQTWGQKKVRKQLLNYLSLTSDMKGYGTHCCHLCENNSQSGSVCLNPLHMYIGTPKENYLDIPPDRRHNLTSLVVHRTKEQWSELNTKVAQTRWANSTPEQRRENTRKATEQRWNKNRFGENDGH